MVHAGLDLSRRRLDVCVLSELGEVLAAIPAPPDGDGLRYLARKVAGHGEPVRAVIESMTGARFVHDTLEHVAAPITSKTPSAILEARLPRSPWLRGTIGP